MLEKTSELKLGMKGEEDEYVVQCEGREIRIKKDRYYTRKHMWAKKISDRNFKIGITDYAQKFLKEKVALVEISKNATVGSRVEAGEIFGTVYGRLYANLDLMRCECVAFDLTAPLSGEIVEINSKVMDDPQIINISPYEKGWIVIIATDPESDLDDLITPSKYKKMLERKEESPFRIV